MKKIFIVLLCSLFSSAVAQDAEKEIVAQDAEKEINEQVWKIFIDGFNNQDTEKFMSVHSKDVVRSSRDANDIIGWAEYHEQTLKGNQRGKENKVKVSIELRFLQRIVRNGLAIETGIYKTTVVVKAETKTQFGKFLVTLRKENNSWKILVDTDSSEGGKITEKDFLEAKPLD